MAKVTFRGFGGEIPRLPAHLLPENGAAEAVNVDLAHGELRGLRGNAAFASGIRDSISGQAITSVYTEDGVNFFGWPYDTYAVKSQVVDDQFYRIFYTAVLDDGPIIKVARTWRNDQTNPIQRVINSAFVGGNFQPPENSNPPPVGSVVNGGPDSWVLGVPAPEVQGVADDDKLTLTLSDLPEWPGIPHLALRVTYFLENPTGQIIAQLDISNNETANQPTVPENPGGAPWVHGNVFWTNDSGNNEARRWKIQDLLSALGPSQRPYKYYYFIPPDLDTLPIGRTVIIVNDGTDLIVTYGATADDPTPLPPNPDGSGSGGSNDGGSGGGSGDPGGGDVGDSDGTGDGGDTA